MKLNTQDILKKVAELKKSYHESAKELIAPAMQALVTGQIKGYRFTAYTPYFNDGEECTYRVNDVQFQTSKVLELEPGVQVEVTAFNASGEVVKVNKDMVIVKLRSGKIITLPVSEITIPGNDEDSFEKSSWDLDGEAKKQAVEIDNFISNIPEDMIRDIFGDHVEITVRADTVTTEKYDHE